MIFEHVWNEMKSMVIKLKNNRGCNLSQNKYYVKSPVWRQNVFSSNTKPTALVLYCTIKLEHERYQYIKVSHKYNFSYEKMWYEELETPKTQRLRQLFPTWEVCPTGEQFNFLGGGGISNQLLTHSLS